MINTSKPTTSIVNSFRVVPYETWDTNINTWDSETRTWDECSSNMSNTARVTSSIVNTNKP